MGTLAIYGGLLMAALAVVAFAFARAPDLQTWTEGLLKNRLSNASTGRSRDQRHDRSSRRGQAAFASWMFGRRSGSAAKVRMSAKRAAASRFRLIAAAVR